MPSDKPGIIFRRIEMANEKEINGNKPFYSGHRKRLRTRYMENGIDSLMEHEILEFILFHSIPRVDTKPISHKLIDRFGSLKNVLCASGESLKEAGLSDISVAHIRLFNDMNNWLRRNGVVGKKLCDYNETGLLMVNEFDNCNTEKLIALMLDSKDEVIELKTICEGSFRGTSVNMKCLVKSCLDRNAAKVVIAHNHPSGDIRPSAEDHVTTSSVENYLSGVGIELVEHYIVADGTYFGIKRNGEDARRGIEEHYRRNFGFYDET